MQSTSEAKPVVPPSVIAIRTTVGRVNNNACHYFHAAGQLNKDAPDFTSCIVCTVSDEEGDHQASSLLTDIHTQVLKRIYLPLVEIPNAENREPISEALQALYSQIDQEKVSLTIALFIGNIVYVGHIGDTRAYFVYDDYIEQITIDRSYIRQLIASQHMTEAPSNALINVRQSLPLDHWTADVYIRKRYTGGRFVLCSEGLSRLVTADEIQQIVIVNSPHQAVNQLVHLANERDGTESMSVMIG